MGEISTLQNDFILLSMRSHLYNHLDIILSPDSPFANANSALSFFFCPCSQFRVRSSPKISFDSLVSCHVDVRIHMHMRGLQKFESQEEMVKEVDGLETSCLNQKS